jgi:hypothetical protein
MSVPLNPVALSDVRAEFGGISTTPLTSYLKGGAFVPVQTIAPIPTVLPINLMSFAGATYPGTIAFNSASNDGGYTITTAVVAPDLSTATFVLARTLNPAGGSSWFDVSTFRMVFDLSGVSSPSVVVRLPATQPRDGAGYWKQSSNQDIKRVVSPAQLIPLLDYTTFEHWWHVVDTTTTYQGELRINTAIPLANGAAPPQYSPAVAAGQVTVPVTIMWQMNIGTAAPPGSPMSWNTRNVTNTFVEFPLILDLYDGAVLRASYPMLLHLELNATTNFTPS